MSVVLISCACVERSFGRADGSREEEALRRSLLMFMLFCCGIFMVQRQDRWLLVDADIA